LRDQTTVCDTGRRRVTATNRWFKPQQANRKKISNFEQQDEYHKPRPTKSRPNKVHAAHQQRDTCY
jgi:hypothetical protein